MPTFTNTATLSYNGGTVNSNTVSGTIREVLTVTKTAVNNYYSVGDNVTYVISLVNTGDTDLTGVTLSDNLGAFCCNGYTVYPLDYNRNTARYYVNGVLQAAPVVTNNEDLVISGITVPANGNAMLIYQATVTQYAPPRPDGEITNRVNVSGRCSPEITDTETISAGNTPRLIISKAVSPTVVNANGTLTYTFCIQNTGNTPAVATDNLVVTDTFDPVLNITAVTCDGAAWNSSVNYSYNNVTGQFATFPGQITVPAATYARDNTGCWVITPGVCTITVTGTIS